MKYFKISRYSICWKKKFQKHHFSPKFKINIFLFEVPPNCRIVTPFITALFFHFQNVEICSTDPLVVARPPTIKIGIKNTVKNLKFLGRIFFFLLLLGMSCREPDIEFVYIYVKNTIH